MIELKQAKTTADYQTIEQLAREIMPEVYQGIVPPAHVDFFLTTFQTTHVIARQINEAHYQYYLLWLNGQVAGYLGIQLLSDRIHLSKLYVLKKFRGKKLGKAALEFVDKVAQEKGANQVDLFVNIGNKETINFYKKAGYTISDTVTHQYDNGHSETDHKMEKVYG
ncbi:GNAT family N-acetyltransferase [uncultured Microscilla sp.]|uniref:GNAT family N-acetyltransferase n=1 Tax=uncultured Microscilla sp. TaxID=432653 RepID=UPI002634EBD2|nr:GNAT family N-acetyltransferase [uncultured Microscilla sp.]